jgi:hypothetical protein
MQKPSKLPMKIGKPFRVAKLLSNCAAVAAIAICACLPSAQAAPPPGAEARIQAQAKAHAAELRSKWLASGHQLEEPGAAPKILKGKLLTNKLDVADQPAAPELYVKFKTGASGVEELYAYFYSTSGQELTVFYDYDYYAPPLTAGSWTIQQVGSNFGYGTFNAYSEPGTWTLSYAYIYDKAGNYTYYSGSDLTDLFGRVTLDLKNRGKPDTVAPVVLSGHLLTKKVSIGGDSPYFAATIKASDNRSGVRYMYVSLQSPSGDTYVGNSYSLPSPTRKATATVYDYLGDQTERGTWTIYEYEVCDIAYNCIYDSTPADIMTLFGTTTIQVTK